MTSDFRKEFERDLSKFYKSGKYKRTEIEIAEFGARWMAERCAKLASEKTQTMPHYSDIEIFSASGRSEVAREIRQLAKELCDE